MSNSDKNWELWGERDPYYAVLTDARYSRDNIPGTRDEFFATGSNFISDTIIRLEQHFGVIPRSRALDFGCGVGRLTIALPQHFGTVTGVDISEAMLEEARTHSANLPIDYCLSDDTLSRVEGEYDFINSLMVFQHIPVDRGMQLMDALLSRIRVGGGCAIHISVKRRQSWRGRMRYFLTHHVPGGQAISNLMRGRPLDTPVMQMNEYCLPDILRLFRDKGFGDQLMRHEDHGGIDTVLILARRL